MKIIDRYLLREMAGPFVFGVLAFVVFFVSANILFKLTELVGELGLSMWTAGELFLLWLPRFVVLTFPLATLVAVLIAFGRLSGDSELVAMHAGGISFRRLVLPIAVAGLMVSMVTAAFNELVVPACNRRAEDIVRAAAARAGEAQQQEIFHKQAPGGQLTWLLYAERLDVKSGEMYGLVITWFQGGRPRMVTVAQRAKWQGEEWKLYHGTYTSLEADRPAVVDFEAFSAKLPSSPEEIARESREPTEMTYRELREHIRYTVDQNRPTTELELSLHHKFSIPFACLVFALIAPPLGMRSHRGSSSIGMGIAILIGFAYYVVWHYLSAVSQQGLLSPSWAAWLPNLVTAAVGATLILRVRK